MNAFAFGLETTTRVNVNEGTDVLSTKSLAPVLPKEATFENNDEDSTLYLIKTLAPKPPAEADFNDEPLNAR